MFLPCLNISGCLEKLFVIFSEIQSRAASLVQGLCSNRNGGSRPGMFLLKTLEQPPEQQREMPKCWKTSQPFGKDLVGSTNCWWQGLCQCRCSFCLQQLTWKTLSQTSSYHCWCRVLPALFPVTVWALEQATGTLLVSKCQSPRQGLHIRAQGHIQWLLVIQLLKINTGSTNF